MRYIYCFILFITFNHLIISQPIGIPIDNISATEYFPAISLDGHNLIYVWNIDNMSYIFESTLKADSTWAEPSQIEALNNYNLTESYIRDPSISYNGQILYFSAKYKDSKGGYDIYYSKKTGDKWSQPVNIGSTVNTSADEISPSISGNDKNLYFIRTSNDPEKALSNCGKIFVSNRTEEGGWTIPEELPKPINEGCEGSVWICADNKTVLISSIRENRDNFDIFYSKIYTKGVWLIPLPVDEINTDLDELHPSTPSLGNIIYFHRKEVKKKYTNSEIIQYYLPQKFKPQPTITIEGKIFNQYSKKPIEATIKVTDLNTSSFIILTKSDWLTGSYRVVLSKDQEYLFEYFKQGFSYNYFDLNKIQADTSLIRKDIFLFPTVDLIINVLDEEIFEPLESDIIIFDEEKKENISTKILQEEIGRYKIELPIGKKYMLYLNTENFISDTLPFNLDGIVQYNEFERDIELTPVKQEFEINVADLETDEALEVEIVITNLDKNEQIIAKAEKNSEGKYVIKLRKGDTYEVNVKSPKGYSFYNTTVNMESEKTTEKLDVKLKQLKAKTMITLNNITFETNSADLNETSFGELERVVKLMKDNPDIKIEISAHTDDIGTDRYNLKLSNKRAQSVIDYIVNNEIPSNRLIAKGYGESKPLAPNSNDENRAKNRRVELKVVDIQK